MSLRKQTRAVVLTLIIVVSIVGVGSTGTTAAQPAGGVEITSTISEDSNSFEVEISSLSGTQSGCLVVENLDTGETFERNDVSESDQFFVFSDELGGWEAGDVIEATLYDEPFECFTELDTDTQTVEEAAIFDVTIDETNSPVVEGETATVTATIENTGGAAGTQTVDLFIGDFVEDDQSVSLDPGESQQITLEWDTGSTDPGTYDAQVNSENNFDVTSVIINEGEPGTFGVTIDSTTSPVLEGERLNVTATIENTGDTSATKTVDLRIDDFIEDEQSVTLDAGESQQVTLSWETEAGDAGSYDAGVISEDDSDFTDVRVEEPEPPTFEVDLNFTNSPVVEGDTLGVTATITNTGEATGTQEIALSAGGTQRDSRSLTLDGGEFDTLTLEWATTAGDAGLFDAQVASEDDEATTDVEVLAKGELSLDITSTSSPVVEGNTMTVTATVENTGDTSVTESVTLRLGDQTVDSTDVSVDGGETATVTLSWETAVGDAGSYEAIVQSGSASDSVGVTVLEESELSVAIASTNSPVVEGTTLEVTAKVENTGEVAVSDEVSLNIGAETLDTAEVSLDGGETTTVTLRWATSSGDAGEYQAEVAGGSDADSTPVSILEGGEFGVAVTSTNSPVSEGDPLEVTATVENTGDGTTTESVSLTIGNETVDSVETTLAGGDTETVTLTWETASGDAGEYDARVATASNSDSVSVQVSAGGQFAVDISATNSPVSDGDALDITATVENTGGTSTTQSVTLTADGQERDSRDLTLEPGESREITLSWETAGTVPGEYEVTVESQSDSDSSLVTLTESGDDDSLPVPLWALALIVLLLLLLLLLIILYYERERNDDNK
jgi:uncharacterized cupredoxin-like copper-binding protein